MQRRSRAALGVLFAVLLLAAACGKSSDTASTADTSKGGSAPGVGGTAIGFIMVGPKDDYGYNQAVYEGAQEVGKSNPDLKILIEGHTDNVGTPAANLALSDARAAAVKAALVAEHGAAGDRITTKGLGDTKPAVPNATANGRAQNRRVEVVRQ